MVQLEELIHGVRSTIKRLQDENTALREQITAQRMAFEREISNLKRKTLRTTIPPLSSASQLQYNSGAMKRGQTRSSNEIIGTNENGCSPTRPPYKRIHIKQEESVGVFCSKSSIEPESISDGVTGDLALTEAALPSQASFLTRIMSSPETLPSKLQKLSKSLPRRVTDLEFFRLPTQYSDSLSSQSELSPRKNRKRSPSPEIHQEEQIELQKCESPVIEYNDDVIGDSEEEEIISHKDIVVSSTVTESHKNIDIMLTDLITHDSGVKRLGDLGVEIDTYDRPPLKDISNAQKSNFSIVPKPSNSKMTVLQEREATRNKLHELLGQGHSIDLAINPVYGQSWKLTDFEPNPDYTKPKLKRKRGKTTKEQQDIDKFYKLAGPGIHLKSLQWNNEEDEPSEEVNPEFSQYYDRFPSPPGFNDVDFPTTQEEIQRRKYTEQMQQNRIRSRLELALLSAKDGKGAYVFREPIIRQYVKLDRYFLKR